MNIIRRIDDGVEFFTVESTGESGMSVSGLARLCGVSQQAVSKLTKSVTTKNAPKRLKSFEGKELTLTTNNAYRNTTVYTAEYCAAVIKHYAFEGREEAEFALEKFTTDGINLWIQSITGWNQSDNKKLPIWDEARSDGKDIFRNLADAVKRYIERHPERSDNRKKFLYPNTIDKLNLNTFGKRSKALKEERGVSKGGLLRDSFSVKELFNVSRIEDLAARLIDDQDMYPSDAVLEAMDRMLLTRLR